MDKRILLIRWGAYGDHMHMSNTIKAFDELGWEVHMEANFKGAQIHAANPRLRKFMMFEPYDQGNLEKFQKDKYFFKHHLDRHNERYDKVVTFQNSLEETLIEPAKSYRYWWPLKKRRAKNTHICYYDQSMIWAGLTDKKFMGWTGEVYFDASEHKVIGDFMDDFKDKFVILWALRGTMWQKATFHGAKDTIAEFTRRHPETVVITTGDDWCKRLEWEAPNVIHKSGRWPFRQVLLLSKYVDLVVTPETGLGIGAGVYSTPKIMMLTAASLKNIVGNDKNDFSLQSDAWCSPCTRAIYDTDNCPIWEGHEMEGVKLPICVNFSQERVLARMEEAYALHRDRAAFDPSKKGVYM